MRARRNMALQITDPQGNVIEFDTVEEFLDYSERGGGYPEPGAPPLPVGRKLKRYGTRGKERHAAAEAAAVKRRGGRFWEGPWEDRGVTSAQARAIGNHIGGFVEYCPAAERARERGGRLSHREALRYLGLSTRGEASKILTAMKDAGVNLWGKERTAQSKQEARQILSQHGISCPI